MTKPRPDCHYCDIPFGPRFERDHAPVPANVGGTEVVVTCPSCHHLKDRMTADGLPLPAYVLACQELASFECVDFTTWPPFWDDLSREARLLWAKIAREVARGEVSPLPA